MTISETPTDEITNIATQARRAQQTWSRVPVEHRVKLLKQVWKDITHHQETLISVIQEETSRSKEDIELHEIDPVRIGLLLLCEQVEKILKDRPIHAPWFAFNKRAIIRRRACGVVSVIGTSSRIFVLLMLDTFCALLAGNAIILKTSSKYTRIALWLSNRVSATGLLPDGLFSVVVGDEVKEDYLIDLSDMVFFTGPLARARRVKTKSSETLKSVVIDVDGEMAMIICAEAPVERWLNSLERFLMLNGLENMVHLFIESSIYELLLDQLKKRHINKNEEQHPSIMITKVSRIEEAIETVNLMSSVKNVSIWSLDSDQAENYSYALKQDIIGVNETIDPIWRHCSTERILATTKTQWNITHEWPVEANDFWWGDWYKQIAPIVRRFLNFP